MERQDALEARLESVFSAIENQHKNLENLFSPLSFEIDGKLDAMKTEFQKESKSVRRMIRDYEANMNCIAQLILPRENPEPEQHTALSLMAMCL